MLCTEKGGVVQILRLQAPQQGGLAVRTSSLTKQGCFLLEMVANRRPTFWQCSDAWVIMPTDFLTGSGSTRTLEALLDDASLYLHRLSQSRPYFFCCLSPPEVTITMKSYVLYPCTFTLFPMWLLSNLCFWGLCMLPPLASAHSVSWLGCVESQAWSFYFPIAVPWRGFPASVPLLMLHSELSSLLSLVDASTWFLSTVVISCLRRVFLSGATF